MSFYADLHTHTTRSDGNDSPAELIRNAEKAGVSVIGIADHDVLPPETIEEDGTSYALDHFAAEHHVKVLPGVEFSCQTYIEDTHLVCYGCDFRAPALRELTDEISRYKEEGYAELLERLTACGMPLSVEEVLAATPGMRLADLQKKRIFDMMAQKGYAPDWKAAKLMVRSEASLQVKRKKPDAVRVLALVHAAGGRIILAHPFLIDPIVPYEGQRISRWEFIDVLITNGLDGIEYRYPYSKTTCLDRRPDGELWQEIHDRFDGRLFFSSGSDYHNDAKKGTKNGRMIGECGLTQGEYEKIASLLNR